MAVRLPVVLSQTAGASTDQQSREADAVMQLMGTAGIDVSLIGPLGKGTLTGTDQLVLESLERDFAIITSLEPAGTIAALRSLGVAGRRAAHPHDRSAEAGSQRRVFCLRWTDFDSAAALCAALQQILADQQTVAVPIGLMPASAKKTQPTSQGSPSSQAAAADDARQASGAAKPLTQPPAARSAQASRKIPGRMSAADLDGLVEDLNELNL